MQQQPLDFSVERQVYSISDIVQGVKEDLERSFRNIWVCGEVSDLRTPHSGHWYFVLKDDDASLKAVCFRLQNRYLKFRPRDGLEVLARGSLSVYPPRGELQLIAEWMEPVGQGALRLAFEQLKEKLSKEGFFDPDRKKPLPVLPSKVGIVTSPSGAAIQDIQRVLARRNNRVDILIFPARVQGPEAAGEIARGIRALNRRDDLDAIIVSRGGGSSEDLWAFNEEGVARAIFDSRLPVISAVGHETDFTIADFVADLRAPTPSAAAEIVSGARQELADRVGQMTRRAAQAVRLRIEAKRRRLHRLASSRAFVDAETRLRFYLQRLDELHLRLHKAWPAVADPAGQKTERLRAQLEAAIRNLVISARSRSALAGKQLEAFSPQAVLERGYAIVYAKGRSEIVRDPRQVKSGESVQIQVARGRFEAERKGDEENGAEV